MATVEPLPGGGPFAGGPKPGGAHRQSRAARTPWHLWAVGALGLLWSAGGAFDYLMTQTRDPAYMSQFTAEQLAYFYGFPWWMDAAWALGVWGGVAGAALLLMRRRWAVHAFAVSLAGLAASSLFQAAAERPEGLYTSASAAFMAAVWIAAIFLLWYAAVMRSRGALR